MANRLVSVDGDYHLPPVVLEQLKDDLDTEPAKRITTGVTAPNSANLTAHDRVQRTVIVLPVETSRWRLVFANRNARTGVAYTDACSTTGLWVGNPVYPTTSPDRWVGDCDAVLTQVAAGVTIPTTGADIVTEWVSEASHQFVPHRGKVISWGLVSARTGTGIAAGDSLQGATATGSGNAASATLSSPTVSSSSLYLDVRVEYETTEDTKVLLVVGDSLCLGLGSNAAGGLPHESYPGQASLMSGVCVANLAVGSATPQDWATVGVGPWIRADMVTTVPDMALIALGTNGLGSGDATQIGYLRQVVSAVKALGITKIALATIPARYDLTTSHGKLVNAYSAGATSLVMDYSPPAGSILVGSGLRQETVTSSTVTGTGPYTVTTTALAFPHKAGEPVTDGSERTRYLINRWLRDLPSGALTCLDVDSLTWDSPEAGYMAPRLVSSDGLHGTRAFSQRVGQALSDLLKMA